MTDAQGEHEELLRARRLMLWEKAFPGPDVCNVMSILPIDFAGWVAAELLLIYSTLHHGGAHTFLLTFPARRALDDPLWMVNVDFDEGMASVLDEMWVVYLLSQVDFEMFLTTKN